MKTPTFAHRSHQKGIATLLVSVVILVLMSIIAAYTARTSLLDLALTNNSYRAKQAEAAASAALDFALAYYLDGGADQNNDGTADTLSVPTSLTGGNRTTVQFCDPSAVLTCTAPTNLYRLRIIAQGYSDDDTATSSQSVLVSEESALGAYPKAALTAKGAGTAKLNGNLTVINNNPGGITIWTGTDIGAMTGSFDTKIKVNGEENQVSSVKTKSDFYVGPDIVYNDYSLKSLSYSDFFKQVTGRTQEELIAKANISFTNAADLPKPTADNNYLGGQIIYANTLTFDAKDNLGTKDKPVILIVNGDFEIESNTVINGLVIAKNLTKAVGTARVNGAMIMENVADASGGFTIEMVDSVISNLGKITVKSTVGNSWRDWN
jgi:type II secretory pathway pseudopilin PulG